MRKPRPIAVLCLAAMAAGAGPATRVKDLVDIMGVRVDPTAILVRNTAAALVTATLPAFAQPGSKLDITVAAIGDASNLQGGLLVLTPLKGVDGQVYAVAQGSVVTGGFVAGRGGNSQTVNHPTAGRVPEGAIVERVAPSVEPRALVKLQLRQEGYAAAARIAHAINAHFNATDAPLARAENSGLVTVQTPAEWKARPVEFIAELEDLMVDTDRPPRVVINERTGTIVMGRDVVIAPVTILHGALTVEVMTAMAIAPSGPGGKTAAVPQVSTTATAAPAKNISLNPGASIEDLVRALSAIGSTPRDIIAVLQGLRAAGALQAELEVI